MNKHFARLAFILLVLLASACQTPNETLSENRQSASSPNGMVVTAHPLATAAGVAMLEKGGNAIDAAVAAAFALSVVEPTMSGLGGRLQAIVRTADGVVTGYDATTQAPLTYDQATAVRASSGYPTIGVPGVVKGLTTLLAEKGTLTLAEVMAPAIKLADEGYKVLPGEAHRRASAIKTIRKFKGTSQYFLHGDTTHLAGEEFVQKDLANTLRAIREGGADVFYKGSLAKKIVEDMKANGGYLDSLSLASYTVNKSLVVKGDYRGYTLNGLWMPSYGAIAIEMLQIMENFPLDKVTDAEWGRIVYRANELAYDDRDAQEGEENAKQLTDKAYAKRLADMIREETLPKAAHLGTGEAIPESWMALQGHTTHLSVADKEGNVIALTQSLGPNMGSKVATPGLGFLYASTMGGYLGDIQPGQRASSHISPFIVTKDGQPYLVLGAAGGSMIVTAVVETISRFIDRKLDLAGAIAAGRVQASDSSMLVETHLGSSWTKEDIEQFKGWGLPVKAVDRPASFGRVHAIYYDASDKTWYGVADPDWEGTAAAPTFN
ncbi:MAG: gamma-glutamyltransferase [Cyclobacteriaceae bacterium]|nr:gamma-glutamyltransferase [Flammeovirgaceae bacterium]MCO5271389.1 gamma-glutamyltransferase [Cyclobacteriaceae bacterium]